MAEKKFYIGLDCGGTKSDLLIIDENNSAILKKSYEPVQYSRLGKVKSSSTLERIINDSIKRKKLNIENCKGICIGLAGMRERKDKTELKKFLSERLNTKKIIIESDTSIALHGAFKGEDGLILICGTGSILFGRIDGEHFRAGGWGRILGDYGSGYEIGRMALNHLAKCYDGNTKPTRLSREIEKKFSFKKENLLKHVYQNNFDIQSIVPVVLELANRKDKDALDITEKAVEELLNHFEIFHTQRKKKEKINLALSGSILENNNVLTKKLKNKIKKTHSHINIVNKSHSPSEGAVLMAKNKFKKS